MSVDISKVGNKTGHLWLTALNISLFLGLLISLSDVLVLMLFGVLGKGAAMPMLESSAIKVILTIALWGILWFLLVYPLGRVFKLDMEALGVLPGVLIIVIYAFYMIHNMVSEPPSISLRIFVLICKGFLAMIPLFSWVIYPALKEAVLSSKRRTLTVVVCLIVLLLLAETILALRVGNFLGPLPSEWALSWRTVFSLSAMMVNMLCIVCIVVMLAVFVRFRRGHASLRVLQVFALLIFASSVLTLIFGLRQTVLSKPSAHTGRPVKNVLLIVIDTLRADALSCYGGRRISTPHIDRLAADSILFEKAFAPAPWTIPTVASIMTGVSPLVHMAKHKESVLPDVLPTLAEYMGQAGYLTQAIGSNPMLVRKNFSKGFMSYNFFPKRQDPSLCGKFLSKLAPKKFGYASTTDLTQLAIDWLNPNADNDFFLLVYYYDPHVPYTPPTEYTPDRKPPQGMGTSFSAHVSARSGYLPLTLEQREWVRALYDSEVSYVDDNVGLLLDHLKKLKIYDDTLIILTSDHGEEFWEHDGYEHGHTLYNELLSVPLIIKLPGSSLKTTLSQPILIESIMPTILDLCRIDYNRDYISRGSLVPTWSANPNTDNVEPIVSTAPLYYEDRISVIFNGLKYIRSLVTGRQEFYNLAEDPAESINIARTSASEIKKANEILNKHQSSAENLKKHYLIEKGRQKELDPETRRQLKSLGYVQ